MQKIIQNFNILKHLKTLFKDEPRTSYGFGKEKLKKMGIYHKDTGVTLKGLPMVKSGKI